MAGGCPQKYVTGALAEGEIAAEAILEYLNGKDDDRIAAENKEEALERGGEQELSQTAIAKEGRIRITFECFPFFDECRAA